MKPGAWDFTVGLFGAPGTVGVAGQATRQITDMISAFARAQASVVKTDGRWETGASGAVGVRLRW